MSQSLTRVPIQVTQGCLVASVQVDLGAGVLAAFRDDLLARIRDSGVRGVILDLSGVEVMDVVEFDSIRRTMDMAELMGATPVLVGLSAAIVSALVDLDADTGAIRAAFDLDQAFELLARHAPASSVDDELPDAHTRQR